MGCDMWEECEPYLCLENELLAVEIGGGLRMADGGDRLDGHLEVDWRARADAAQRAASVVRADAKDSCIAEGIVPARLSIRLISGDEGVVVLGAAHAGAAESRADLESLGGGERHHRVRHLGLEPIKDWLAERGWHAPADACDGAAN